MKRLSIRGAALPVVRGIAWAGAIPRGPGRGDLQNPTTGSAAHTVLAAVWDIVAPRLILQRHLVGRRFRRPVLRSQALCYVSPGAPAQPFHCDADGDRQYYTVIVPLTTERSAGGTEFGDGTCYRPVRGTAYYFNGAAVHRGAAHAGRRMRVYAAYVLCAHDGIDQNVFVGSPLLPQFVSITSQTHSQEPRTMGISVQDMDRVTFQTKPAARVGADVLTDLGCPGGWESQWRADKTPMATMLMEDGVVNCIALWTKMDFDPYGEQRRPHLVNYIFTRAGHRRRGLALALLDKLDTALDWNAFCLEESEALFAKAGFDGTWPARRLATRHPPLHAPIARVPPKAPLHAPMARVYPKAPLHAPMARVHPKAPVNGKCPCGSGLKFKKCCM